MRIESLELLLSVAEYGSISQAASHAFISQQGASATIKGIENDFGIVLFDRTKTGLRLTEEGARFVRRADRVVSEYRALRLSSFALECDSDTSGALEIMTTPFVTNRLEKIFVEYETLFPGSRLVITEKSSFEIIDECRDASDERLCIVPIADFMTGILGRVEERYRPLVRSCLMASCSWDCDISSCAYILKEDLCHMPLAYYREEFLDRLVVHLFRGLQPDIRLRTSNLNMINQRMEQQGIVTFVDSFSAFLDRHETLDRAAVPIQDSVYFSVGILGTPDPGSPAGRFALFFERYLGTVCAAYMKHFPLNDSALRED
ncbi:MAG: LysR family transcriptional regulator [Slackia sp.]|nr:LysR family transcriptional regulator [Slackia sp.]